jgi:hypothetical protein
MALGNFRYAPMMRKKWRAANPKAETAAKMLATTLANCNQVLRYEMKRDDHQNWLRRSRALKAGL